MGLSAGSLSRSMLGWVRNIRKEKSDVAKHEMINYEASSAFAVLWGLARSQLLPEIVADFDNFLEKIGPELRMDGDKTMGVDKSGRGKYKITLDEGEREFEFHNAELAPPTGVMAENYCRYVIFLPQNQRFNNGIPPDLFTRKNNHMNGPSHSQRHARQKQDTKHHL